MDEFLKSLRRRRAAIQERIDEEQARPAPDSLRLRTLKALKLHLRERIEFIERRDRQGRVRSIPVLRRRAAGTPLVQSPG